MRVICVPEPGYKAKADFLKKWLDDPQTYPDEFKAWILNYVQDNPNLALPYSALPSGYRASFSEIHVKDSGSSFEQSIYWERNSDGAVIAKISAQDTGSSPNRQSTLKILGNQPDAGTTSLAQIVASVNRGGTLTDKLLLGDNLDTTGNHNITSDYLLVENYLARASGTLGLTTAEQDIAGASFTPGPGTYLVVGVFDMNVSVNGVGVCVGFLNVGGVTQAEQALLQNTAAATGDRATVSQVWVVTTTGGNLFKLRARKTINAGTAQAMLTHTSIMALRIGN